MYPLSPFCCRNNLAIVAKTTDFTFGPVPNSECKLCTFRASVDAKLKGLRALGEWTDLWPAEDSAQCRSREREVEAINGTFQGEA